MAVRAGGTAWAEDRDGLSGWARPLVLGAPGAAGLGPRSPRGSHADSSQGHGLGGLPWPVEPQLPAVPPRARPFLTGACMPTAQGSGSRQEVGAPLGAE